jgi:hypothetical protein
MDIIEEDNHFFVYNFNSIINYIKDNPVQILLLTLVFFIIYVVDHISNINAIIMTQIPVSRVKIPKLRK